MAQTTMERLTQLYTSESEPFTTGGGVNATRILGCHNTLGECILYDDLTNMLLWTDIDGKEFHRLNLKTGDHSFQSCSKKLCAFGLRSKGEKGYLFAWEDGFQLYDVDEQEPLSDMSRGEDVNPHGLPTRLNDGRVDPKGKHFICGGYYGDIEGMHMKVYSCKLEENDDGTNHLVHEPMYDEIQVTNSICWSSDGKTMFLADSPTRTIYKHDYNQDDGTVSNKTTVTEFDIGVPDGSCVDSKGNIWNAMWRNGAGPSKVQCIDPSSGQVLYTVNMPDSTSQITCCCFGGPDLDILFISTANVGRDLGKEPHAGCVYAAKVGVKGCREKRFIGK